MHFLEQLPINGDAVGDSVDNQLVQQGRFHHRRRIPFCVKTEGQALGIIVATVVGIYRVADACQVRGFGQIVATAASPHEHVVGEMTDRAPRLLLRACQGSTEHRDVFVVPGVSVCKGRALPNARDLITVIPPSHDAGILRRVLLDPTVPLQVVVDHDAVPRHLVSSFEDHLRIRKGVCHRVAVGEKVPNGSGEHGAKREEQAAGEACASDQSTRVVVDECPDHFVLFNALVRHVLEVGLLQPALPLTTPARTQLHVPLVQCMPQLPPLERNLLRLDLFRLGLLHVGLGLLPLQSLGRLLHLNGHFRGFVLRVRWYIALLPEQQEERFQQTIQQEAAQDAAADRSDRGAHEDQTRHLTGEVLCDDCVQQHEVEGVVPVPAADQPAEHRIVQGQVQVAAVDASTGRLVLGHRVHQRVAGLGVLHKEAPDARGQRAEVTRGIEHDAGASERHHEEAQHRDAKLHEAFGGPEEASVAPEVAEGKRLEAQKHTERTKLLQRTERLPTHNRDLESPARAHDEEDGVGSVQPKMEPALGGQEQRVHTYHVQHEDVPAPSSGHVDVGESSEHSVRPRVRCADGAEPEPEGAANGAHGHRLVVELSANRAHEVGGDHRHDARSHDSSVDTAGSLIGHETREETCQ
mmetsp:Transcript_57369/g.152972  ORF Transcript_57369/g.152972 Transcript_57369/m.152972 type:complete len:637 (+) Transcript_57369:479-2389(+)